MRGRVICACLGVLAWLGGMAAATPPQAASQIVHPPRVAARVPGGPHHPASLGWASSNWSGYAVTGNGIARVTGSWTVPSVSSSHKATYSSTWVGIDGFNNSSLIQTGTEQDFFNHAPHYAAWWEILPAAETVIPGITVRPGDHFSATITRGAGSTWTITLSDDSTGQSFTTSQTYTGPQTSAEWIQEAPTVGGRIATLADYGLVTFDPGTVNGANPALTSTDGGAMVQRKAQVSTPSNPDTDSDGFTAAYGATQPPPPAS